MVIKPINSEFDYWLVKARLEKILNAAIGTTEKDEANILVLLVNEYEKKHFPIIKPSTL